MILGYVRPLRNKKDFNKCYAFYNSGSLNIKAYIHSVVNKMTFIGGRVRCLSAVCHI